MTCTVSLNQAVAFLRRTRISRSRCCCATRRSLSADVSCPSAMLHSSRCCILNNSIHFPVKLNKFIPPSLPFTYHLLRSYLTCLFDSPCRMARTCGRPSTRRRLRYCNSLTHRPLLTEYFRCGVIATDHCQRVVCPPEIISGRHSKIHISSCPGHIPGT